MTPWSRLVPVLVAPALAGCGALFNERERVVTIESEPSGAEVQIDGERVDTTPIGRPVRVPPGRHELTFKHPNAPDEQRTVDVGPGQRTTVDVEMEVVRIVDAGVDASP